MERVGYLQTSTRIESDSRSHTSGWQAFGQEISKEWCTSYFSLNEIKPICACRSEDERNSHLFSFVRAKWTSVKKGARAERFLRILT